MRWRRRKKLDFPALRDALRSPPPMVRIRREGGGGWLQRFPPRRFIWAEADLPIEGLPPAVAGLRLLHLSDLHLRPAWGAAYDRLLARLAARPPDLILLTGDIIDYPSELAEVLPTVGRLLTGLRSRLGTYAILGNHDSLLLGPRLAAMGVKLIMGRREVVRTGEAADAAVELVGLTGPERLDVTGEFFRALPPRQPGLARITLAHYPDLIGPAQSLDSDLFLAGHTHGGQICLPGGRPIITHDGLPPRFCKGIHRVGRTWLAVSPGLGTTGLPFRLFCPPEVMEISLEKLLVVSC